MIDSMRRGPVLAATLAVLAACGKDSTGPAPVATVRVTGAASSLAIGQSVQLVAATLDANGAALTGRTVAWSSSSIAVATVSATGSVLAVAAGTSTITATSGTATGTFEITVTPPPVTLVRVTSPTTPATLTIGGPPLQLAVALTDATGAVATGRQVTWLSTNSPVATVSQTGLVTAVSRGLAQITATSEGQTGSVQVEVLGVSAVTLAAATPAVLVEGQAATVTGAGFNAVPANNVVRLDGVQATVTASTATSVTFVVPDRGCRPAGAAQLRVAVAGDQSLPLAVQAAPASTFTLARGQQAILRNPSQFCLQFGQSAAQEVYVLGVQSVDGDVTRLTDIQVRGNGAATAATTATSTSSMIPARTAPGRGFADASAVLAAPRAERWQRHRQAELAMRVEDARRFAGRLPALRESRRRWEQRAEVSRSVSAGIPGTVQVGAAVTLKFPDRSPGKNSCRDFIPVNGVVKAVGTKSIWVEDVANPSGGFSASEYQALSDRMDSQIFSTDVEYFGEPTDNDGNGRVVILLTKEINETAGLLGKVEVADLLTPQECPSSNDGEVYYGKAPDPSGAVNGVYALATALEDAPLLIAHEFAHIIQIGRRLANTQALEFQEIWELEGQATFAEEVNGHRADNRSPRQNYGLAIAFNEPATVPINWYLDGLGDLFVYYGFASRTSRVSNAPEQCSWLDRRAQGNSGPCVGGREVYGVPWSLLRWMTDHFGPTFPGGDAGLQRALIDNQFSGFATLADVAKTPIDELLAQWAASLYLDDRHSGLAPRLTFPSWNLFEIENGIVESGRLLPRERGFATFTDDIAVRSGSTAYYRIGGAGRPATSFTVRTRTNQPLPQHMRVWVVRVE